MVESVGKSSSWFFCLVEMIDILEGKFKWTPDFGQMFRSIDF